MSQKYVSNKELFEEMVSWKKKNEGIGIEVPKITDAIGSAIIRICDNLGRSGRFAGYTWRDEMVADAVLACVRGAKNFDPTKSENPFAFLTSIAWNAFIKRINVEKSRLDGMREYREYLSDDIITVNEEDEDYSRITDKAKIIDSSYKKSKKIKIKNPDAIELFMEEE